MGLSNETLVPAIRERVRLALQLRETWGTQRGLMVGLRGGSNRAGVVRATKKTDVMGFALLCFALFPALLFAESRATIQATGQITTRSIGDSNQYPMAQSVKAAPGVAAGWEFWRRSTGIFTGMAMTRTEAELFTPTGKAIISWPLDVYRGDAALEYRFLHRRFRPYAGLGGFLSLTWGGDAPAHSNKIATGFDSLHGWEIPAGAYLRISPRVSLKFGMATGFGKASTYGDQTYRSTGNVTFQTQLGLSIATRRGQLTCCRR